MTECDLQMVGDEFSRKPYALAVQQGSPLKDQLNDAYVEKVKKRQCFLKISLKFGIQLGSQIKYLCTCRWQKRKLPQANRIVRF